MLLTGSAVHIAHGQAAPLPPGTTDTAATSAATAANSQTPAPLVDAEARLAAGEYQGSLALLNPYLSAHPEDARGQFDRGYAEDALNHTQAAEEDYRKAIALDPRQFESRLALGLLLAARSAADPAAAAEARTQLQAATGLQPEPPNPGAEGQAYRALARLIYKSEPEAARQALLAALKLTPETLADTLLTAEIAEAAGDPETAEQAYRGVLASSGGSAAAAGDSQAVLQATTGLAHLLIQAQKYPEAELILRRALTHNAADPVLNSQLARVLMAEDKPQDAIAVLESLHAAQPGDRNVTRMLADLDTQSGQAAKADPLYVALMNNSGLAAPDESLLAARGDNLVRQQRFQDAVLVLQQATKLDPQDGNAWSSLAFAASEDHQPKMVLDALEMRSKVMPETPATYFLAATAWDTLHQTKHAVEMYKQFLAVAGGKFPDEEWQAKHRLVALSR